MSFDDRWGGQRDSLLVPGLDGPLPEVAPGKRTLTMALPAREQPVQAKADPVVGAGLDPRTRMWLDAAVRPDLHHEALPVQRKADGAEVAADAPAPGGGGQAMPEPVQAKMESAFGVDFSAVRIHEGAQAGAVGALAYTQGTDLHFAPGQYDPTSAGGQELLGHELAHVVQQGAGRVGTTTQAKGVALNDDAGLEREADEQGARAARGEQVDGAGTTAAPSAVGAVGAGAAIQRKTSIADDPSDPQNTAAKGTGKGLLQNSAGKIQEGVNFGGLVNDCATWMEAWLSNDMDPAGTEPKGGTWPSWWAAAAPNPNNYWVRGHLLNHNLGGPGEKRNLTPITKAANSEHHNNVEKVLKRTAEVGGTYIGYKVVAKYDGTGPTGLKGDANDPDKSVWQFLTLGFDCEYVIMISPDKNETFATFVENKR